MLTLDEPDHLPADAPPPGLLVSLDEARWLQEVFHTMRDWFDEPPAATNDPERLYRSHGDPRD